MSGLLKNLNPAQAEAAARTEGPLLVLAGAGSGKTRVLTYRIAHLLEKGVAPWNILAITFTNKAAREMAERVEKLAGAAAQDIWVRTFHSACVRILRRDIDRIGYERSFNIIDSDDQKSLVKACLSDLRLDDKMFPPRTVLGEISRAKDQLQSPKAFADAVGSEYRMSLVAKIYALYQQKLQTANCLDFDDLITQTVALFEAAPDVLDYYRRKFRYILVDEYQDTNNAQYALISLLAKEHRNLCVVGDDDQSIYKFRGANIRNILDFEKEFPDAKVVRLEQNYRSTQNILDAANAVISNNKGRKGKNLWSDSGEGVKVTSVRTQNDLDEARYIADEISRLYNDGFRYGEIAVLYRTNVQSRALEEIFVRSALPYRVLSGLRFYERMEIRDIIAYLRLVKNPDDDISLMRIINVPSRKIGKVTTDMIAELARRQGTSLLKAILDNAEQMKESAVSFANLITSLRRGLEGQSVDETVSAVIEQSGYFEHLKRTTENAEDRMENVRELVSGAANYAAETENPSFEEYMDNLALISDIDNYDEELDAALLMTLHTAKGLEFPAVFICGMDDGLFPSSQAIFDPEEIEEERRLCYVGITRAMTRLYLTGAKSRMVYGKTGLYMPSRFLEEIPKGLVEQVSTLPQDFADKKTAQSAEPPGRAYTTQSFKKPEKPTPGGDISFTAGDRVRHAKFGAGTVLSATPVGNDVHYEIAFDSVGTKNMLGLYARLGRE